VAPLPRRRHGRFRRQTHRCETAVQHRCQLAKKTLTRQENIMLNSRIVVVEDETIVALNLQQSLMKLGYDVPAVVPSGEQALANIKELDPDIVLMDVNIQGA